MNLPKRLLLVFLLVLTLAAARPVSYQLSPCDVELSAVSTRNLNEASFTLTITASGGQAPYYYLLLDDKGNLVSKDFKKHVFHALSGGRYRCIVSDIKDCTKEQFIEVK